MTISMSNETIISKTYNFVKSTLQAVEMMPKSYKFTFGDRLQTMAADLLELSIEAYYAPRNEKRRLLLKINILLEKMRHFFRLGYELGLYNSKKYEHFAQQLNEIGKMIGGWLKSLK